MLRTVPWMFPGIAPAVDRRLAEKWPWAYAPRAWWKDALPWAEALAEPAAEHDLAADSAMIQLPSAAHDFEHGLEGTAPSNFAYRWRFKAEGELYRTARAYDPEDPIPRFSNLSLLFAGVPMVVPADDGDEILRYSPTGVQGEHRLGDTATTMVTFRNNEPAVTVSPLRRWRR